MYIKMYQFQKTNLYPEHLEKFEIKMDCTPWYILQEIKSFP